LASVPSEQSHGSGGKWVSKVPPSQLEPHWHGELLPQTFAEPHSGIVVVVVEVVVEVVVVVVDDVVVVVVVVEPQE